MDLIERATKKANEEKSSEKSSLVERAAARNVGDPKSIAIGKPGIGGERKPDPSSLNPNIPTEAKKPFRGIGRSSVDDGSCETPPAESAAGGTTPDEAKRSRLAIGVPGSISATEIKPVPAVTKDVVPARKEQQVATKPQRPPEEIDLLALREDGYITPDMPPNLMSEEFRIIKRSILLNAFAKGDQKIKNGNIILVTSANPGEGKTFCTINLALSIATEQDVTVLLVDADFSKPEVLNRLGVAGGRGLMDVVADDELDLADCLIRTNIPNLVLLPAGRQHNLTTELLASDRMAEMVREISTRYPDRLVIFDSPPVLASSAASVLALYMGQTVFVIEAEKTSEPQIKESLSMISACDHINLILNKTRYSGSNKKFASYYGYGGR